MNQYYLWTIGCQMNDADAVRVADGLLALGMTPAASAEEADLVVLVTCVVRQSAEDKVTARLASLKNLRRRSAAHIVVMGCFVSDVPALRQAFPHVDAFFAPSDISGLLLWAADTLRPLQSSLDPVTASKPTPTSALVPISYGCDHHCTYCIVRLRRGPQLSRPVPEIVSEVTEWTDRGARQVTLLGQNVDAYGQDLGANGPDLADLLEAVHGIDGLWRLRFLTSHPAHLSDKLIDTVARLGRVCPHFELPVQSGDDQVLRRMGRGYTAAQYRSLVQRIRRAIPAASVATDVIVGFPGETEQQFQATADLLAGMRLDAVHLARYSPRPGTPSALMTDDVPELEKERRRVMLESLQKSISADIHAGMVGSTVTVLVEGRQRQRWKGRTVNNRLVFFDHQASWTGRLAQVLISSAGSWSVSGELVGEVNPDCLDTP